MSRPTAWPRKAPATSSGDAREREACRSTPSSMARATGPVARAATTMPTSIPSHETARVVNPRR